MIPMEIPEWVRVSGPLGVALYVLIYSHKNRSPDNPPPHDDKHDKLEARVTQLEKTVAVLKDRSDRDH